MDTEGEGDAGTSQSQSRRQGQMTNIQGQMTNIYLTDSDEEAIVDFVKDHADLVQGPFLMHYDSLRQFSPPEGILLPVRV